MLLFVSSEEYLMNQLKRVRLERGLSQAGLAALAGVNRMTVSRIEAGELPHMSTAVKLGAALSQDWRFLFEQNATETKPEPSHDHTA